MISRYSVNSIIVYIRIIVFTIFFFRFLLCFPSIKYINSYLSYIKHIVYSLCCNVKLKAYFIILVIGIVYL